MEDFVAASGSYTKLLDNPAVSGLALQVYWARETATLSAEDMLTLASGQFSSTAEGVSCLSGPTCVH